MRRHRPSLTLRVIEPGDRVQAIVDALDEFGIRDEHDHEPGTVAIVLDTEMTPAAARAALGEADPSWEEVVAVVSVVDIKGNELT